MLEVLFFFQLCEMPEYLYATAQINFGVTTSIKLIGKILNFF